jgi:hypothetical protein
MVMLGVEAINKEKFSRKNPGRVAGKTQQKQQHSRGERGPL